MSGLPGELRDLIESGPFAHLSTINADGSPQVSVIWIGLDGDDIVSGHMQWYAKLRNIERDPRVVLSFVAPRVPGAEGSRLRRALLRRAHRWRRPLGAGLTA
jgi:PPOX class probable F420-dependent enzyme